MFLFNRYDSLTGVPVSQQNLLLEKASILFNTGALYTQIGTRSNRQMQAGLESAVDAFQRAAGVSPGGCRDGAPGTPAEEGQGILPRPMLGLTGLKGPDQSSTGVSSHQENCLMAPTLSSQSRCGSYAQ